MKTLLGIFVFALSSLLSFSQITLENTYSYSVSVSNLENQEYFYFLMDVPQSQCRLYSTDHVLYKTINLTVPDGYYLSDIKFVTKNLFNTDDLIELLYIYEKYVTTTTGYYFQYGLGVVSETGNQLLTLPNGGWAEIKEVGDENKLLAYSYIYNPAGYYDVMSNIYMLGGDVSYVSYQKKETGILFPNPASDQIRINTNTISNLVDGVFSIYTISGKKVSTMPINMNEEFSASTKHLASGTYIYTITDGGKMVQSNKLIIK